jgi:hypothetical protein
MVSGRQDPGVVAAGSCESTAAWAAAAELLGTKTTDEGLAEACEGTTIGWTGLTCVSLRMLASNCGDGKV